MAKIQIFKPVTGATSMEGVSTTLTAADLQAIATAYNPAVHEAPLTIGHPTHDAPAYGWVRSLNFADGTLVADTEQSAELGELVSKGHYKKVSASFYRPAAPGNPTPGQWALRHVGFLGAQPPGIKGLKAVSFAEREEGVVTFGDLPGYAGGYIARLFRGMREWLIAKEGMETADRVLPDWEVESLREMSQRAADDAGGPAESVPALSFAEHQSTTTAAKWLAKAIKLHEGHMDGSVATTDASQQKMMDMMVRAYEALTGDESSGSKSSDDKSAGGMRMGASFAEAQLPLSTATQEKPSMRKTPEQLQTELDAAQAENKTLKDAERQRLADGIHAGNVSFAESLIAEARWPAESKDVLVATLDHLSRPSGVVSFGEGDAAKPLAEVLQAQLKAMPPSVSFGEFAKKGSGGSEAAGPGAIAGKAVAYQNEQAARGVKVNTAEAVAHVSRSAD